MASFLGLFDPSLEDESPGNSNAPKPSKRKNKNQRKNNQVNSGNKPSRGNSPDRGLLSNGNNDLNSGTAQLNNFNEEATRRRSTVNMLDKYNDWAREKQAQQRINSKKNVNVVNNNSTNNKNTNKKSKKNKINNNCQATVKSNLNRNSPSDEAHKDEANNNVYQNVSISLSKSLNINKINENVVRIGSCIREEQIPIDEFKLKDINKDSTELGEEDEALPDHLPSEPQEGNIEYKLKLLNPNQERLKRLVSQMQWRLREGLGEAIYEIGVEDSGLLLGLTKEELTMSMATLRRMARQLGASLTVIREKSIGEDGKKVAEVLVRKVPDDQYSIELRIAVLGSSDVGKSTLLGVLTRGELDNGRGCARLNVFRHRHEVYSGKTSSISIQTMGFDANGNVVDGTCTRSRDYDDEDICSQSSKIINFIDLAGDQRYLHTTAFGLSGYCPHYAMLVVSAFSGLSAMSEKHLALARAVDLPLLLVVTKTDLATPQQLNNTIATLKTHLTANPHKKVPLIIETADDAITAGSVSCHDSSTSVVPIFLVSSVSGEGLQLLKKFLFVLPPKMTAKEREKSEQEVTQFQIDEVFHVEDRVIVGGLLTAGVLPQGATLMLGPFDDCSFAKVTVESIHRNKVPCRVVCAGQSASLSLSGSQIPTMRKGMKLLAPETKPRAAYYFQARIRVVSGSVGVGRGCQLTAHIGNVRQTVVVAGVLGKSRVRSTDSQTSSVLLRFLRQPEYVSVGSRILLRQGNITGVGQLLQVFGETPNTSLKFR